MAGGMQAQVVAPAVGDHPNEPVHQGAGGSHLGTDGTVIIMSMMAP